MLKKLLKQKEYQALSEFKKTLYKKLKGGILELKLFGSKARGDSRKDSDIDVLIVLKNKSKTKEDFIIDLTVKLLLKYEVDISPHIYSEKELLKFKKIPSIFLQIVDREAVPV